MTHTLPIRRYVFRVQVQQPLRLPAYAGSMLRGAFGHALRRLACMTRKPECTACPLLGTCPYAQIFETPPLQTHTLQKFSHMPNPYVIEPPLQGNRLLNAGDEFEFSMVLMGDAIAQLPLILMAWERALSRGLSKAAVPARLVQVNQEHDPEPVYWPHAGAIRPHQPLPAAPGTIGNRIRLRFITPLRMQKQGGRVGKRELDARTLLMTLARRYQLLCDRHQPGLPPLDFNAIGQHAEKIRLQHKLRWHDWTRYSNRQQQEMKFGGLMGQIDLQGELTPFSSLLHLGQWLHLGKNTSFGLGHYQLEQAPQQQEVTA